MALFKSEEEKKQEYLKKGLEYENKNENDRAIKEFEKILKMDPADEDALFNLGFIFSDMRQYKNAYAIFKKLINTNPKHTEAYNSLGLLFARQGKYSDSLFVYQKGIENNPDAALLYNNMGNLLYNMGRYADALTNFKKAGDLNPAYSERLYHLGIDAFIKGGEMDDAIKKLEEAAKKNMNKAKTIHDLGMAYLEQHMYDKAVASFNQALAIDNNYISAYINLGYAYQHKENYMLAIKALERAAYLNPKNAKLYNTIGLLYDKMENPDTAVKAYKKAVELDPAYSNAHYMLAQIYQNRGNTDKAIAEFTTQIRIQESGAIVDDCIQRIADLKNVAVEEVQKLFSRYIKPQEEKKEIKTPPEVKAAVVPPVAAPVINTPAETEEDRSDYMKKLGEKIKQEQAARMAAETAPVLQSAPVVLPPVNTYDFQVIDSGPQIVELPTFEESAQVNNSFMPEPSIQVVSLEGPSLFETPQPPASAPAQNNTYFPPEAYRETIIKAVGSDAPLPTDSMPEFNEAAVTNRQMPVKPAAPAKPPAPKEDDNPPPPKITRSFY
jgi:tetratricopeptide (TPR) repeat protein